MSTALMAPPAVGVCEVEGCDEQRVTLLYKGRIRVAKTCEEHSSAAVRVMCERLAQEGDSAPVRAMIRICGARNRKGSICKRPAGWGTDHVGYKTCKLHGGNMLAMRKAAAKDEAVEVARKVMGQAVDVDPLYALLQCVKIAAGAVEYCTIRVHELTEDEAAVTTREVKTRPRKGEYGMEEHGDQVEEVTTSTAAALNVWIGAQANALDRLAKFCKMALDAGVAERQVQVAEQMGSAIGRMMQNVLGDLKLTPAQEALAPSVVGKHLAILEGTVVDA